MRGYLEFSKEKYAGGDRRDANRLLIAVKVRARDHFPHLSVFSEIEHFLSASLFGHLTFLWHEL